MASKTFPPIRYEMLQTTPHTETMSSFYPIKLQNQIDKQPYGNIAA